jgi:leuA_bact: 2-isopropylmalate synthase
LRLHHLVMVR